MKKTLPIIGGSLTALALAQLYVLGAKGGIGPLGFIRRNQIAGHPGNGEEYSFKKLAPRPDSPLRGKKICVLGSSVVFGAASNEMAVAEYLAHRFDCAYTKEAVSGTTLCDIGPDSYVSRLKKLDKAEKYDLFLCQLSTNDATRKLPLGEPGSDNTKTVTGAITAIVRYIRRVWGCPVVFFTGSRYDSKPYAAMVRRLLELQGSLGFGVIDLWNADSFNSISKEQRKLFMADGIHPTRAGYRDWWGPEMEKQLLILLSNKKL